MTTIEKLQKIADDYLLIAEHAIRRPHDSPAARAGVDVAVKALSLAYSYQEAIRQQAVES